ncbi:MAG: FtsX-like permease family protein [Spirosomataceae bacterium]
MLFFLIPTVCAVAIDLKMGEQEGTTTNTPPPLGIRLKEDFPEIELMARTFDLGNVLVKKNKLGNAPKVFHENTAMAVDTAFLELFGVQMVEGDAFAALDSPGSIVLTEQMALKYFGTIHALGESIELNERLFKITGVVKDLPTHSTLQFGFLLPMSDFRVVNNFSWSWIWLQMDTWIRLRTPVSDPIVVNLEKKFPAMVRKYAPAAYERIGQNFEDQLKRGDRYEIKLLPLKKLHLGYQELFSRLSTLGDGHQVQMFSIIGLLILLLACVNFMNLSTARSMRRSREVGVRKALGSQKGALIGQFLTESLVNSIIAMLIAAMLVSIVLPFYNQLTGLEQTFTDLYSGSMLVFLVLLPFVTGLLGGLYPAFYLSSFKAIEMFKPSSGRLGGGHVTLRSGLVVFQFTVSIVLMLGSFVVFKQLKFAQNVSPGLEREPILVIDNVRQFFQPFGPRSLSAAIIKDARSKGSFSCHVSTFFGKFWRFL